MVWLNNFGLESFLRLLSSESFVGIGGCIFEVVQLGWKGDAGYWWMVSVLHFMGLSTGLFECSHNMAAGFPQH